MSFEALRSILCNEIGRGIYEVVVHPGYLDARANDVYYLDRQWEAETLADPHLLGLLREERISLISYHELSEAIAQLERDRGWIGAPTASRTG